MYGDGKVLSKMQRDFMMSIPQDLYGRVDVARLVDQLDQLEAGEADKNTTPVGCIDEVMIETTITVLKESEHPIRGEEVERLLNSYRHLITTLMGVTEQMDVGAMVPEPKKHMGRYHDDY